MAAADSTPALALAIYTREGRYTRAYGVTDIGSGAPATTDTAFYIASTTKPLTSLAFSAMHARGDFDLDRTLADYAPDAPFPAAVRAGEVSFRHMLTHTHGIANDPIGHRVAYSGLHDPQTLWRLLGVSRVNTEAPLGNYQYANIGYNITTVLTDHAMGVRWQDLLQREIFQPAGMTRTSARMSDAATWSLARPHQFDPQHRVKRIYLQKTDQTMQSAGGVIMSANDALRWLELMIEGGKIGGRRVLPESAINATRAPFADTGSDDNGVRVHYGLGWNSTSHKGEPGFYHSGGFSGARSIVSYLPQRGVGVAIFCNEDALAGPLFDALMYYVYDLTDADAGAATALDSRIAVIAARRQELGPRLIQGVADRASRPWRLARPRAAYAGLYRNDNFGEIAVAASGEDLEVRFGVMHATAEPFTQPESIRLELVPGSGTALRFDPDGPTPGALSWQGERFVRN